MPGTGCLTVMKFFKAALINNFHIDNGLNEYV